jgi:hypothetical protein
VLYTTFRGTSFQMALRPAIVVTCFAGLWCWMIVLLEQLSPEVLGTFLQHCKVLATLNDSLRTYVSFMFVNYTITSLQLWSRILYICNEIDDRAVTIAINASALLHTDSPRDKRLRWKVYRYVTLAHFLVYGTVSKSVSAKAAFFTTQFLAVGLLTETEKVALDASASRKITVILWLSQMLNHEEVSERVSDKREGGNKIGCAQRQPLRGFGLFVFVVVHSLRPSQPVVCGAVAVGGVFAVAVCGAVAVGGVFAVAVCGAVAVGGVFVVAVYGAVAVGGVFVVRPGRFARLCPCIRHPSRRLLAALVPVVLGMNAIDGHRAH